MRREGRKHSIHTGRKTPTNKTIKNHPEAIFPRGSSSGIESPRTAHEHEKASAKASRSLHLGWSYTRESREHKYRKIEDRATHHAHRKDVKEAVKGAVKRWNMVDDYYDGGEDIYDEGVLDGSELPKFEKTPSVYQKGMKNWRHSGHHGIYGRY
ncbi:hypothetical protein HDV00_002974 [Rhizophlyctis rosea]|nr:hypothetical protein HDV00_002974 [Rhizophlyctis rosea]